MNIICLGSTKGINAAGNKHLSIEEGCILNCESLLLPPLKHG